MTTKMQRKISLAVLETARETLEAIPPAPKEMREVGIGEVLRALTPTIRKLFAKGYSKTKVIELLNEQGVPAPSSCMTPATSLQPRPTVQPYVAGSQSGWALPWRRRLRHLGPPPPTNSLLLASYKYVK